MKAQKKKNKKNRAEEICGKEKKRSGKEDNRQPVDPLPDTPHAHARGTVNGRGKDRAGVGQSDNQQRDQEKDLLR